MAAGSLDGVDPESRVGPLAQLTAWQSWREPAVLATIAAAILTPLIALAANAWTRRRRRSLRHWIAAEGTNALDLADIARKIDELPWPARKSLEDEYRGKRVAAYGVIRSIEPIDAHLVRISIGIDNTNRVATLAADRSRNPLLLHAGPGWQLAAFANLQDIAGQVFDLGVTQTVRLHKSRRRPGTP